MSKKEKSKCLNWFQSYFSCYKSVDQVEDESSYEHLEPYEALYTACPPGAYNQCDEKFRSMRGQHATFGLGMKFWFSEPLFGVIPGVQRTCVGFCGGKKPNPAHADSLDHTQCVHIEFDPNVVTYRDLVKYFFANHDSSRRHLFKEFESLILYHDAEQKEIAVEELDISCRDRPCFTRVAPARHFYLADDEHQKYILLNYPALMEALHLVVGREMIYSHRATVLNGFMAGCASVQEFEKIKADLMLPQHVVIFLRRVIEANQPKVLDFPQFKIKLRL